MGVKIVTIGVYGFTESAFFQAIEEAGVDTFVDLRLRRGMRGSTYAFVNSTKLQESLRERNIRYVHIKELAPSKETRAKQKSADAVTGTAKRARVELSTAFKAAYHAQCLSSYTADQFFAAVGDDCQTAVLFCVEKQPQACHRSLVAEFLNDAGERIEAMVDLLPEA